MMTRLGAVLCMLALPLASYGQTAAELFQAGLAAEKGEGDLASAARSYAAVIERYGSGGAAADWAVRAQERLERLQKQLGPETVVPQTRPSRPSRPSGLLGRGLGSTGRRLQALHRNLGLRGLQVLAPEPSGGRPEADLWYPSWAQRLGLAGYTLDPLALDRGRPRLVFLTEPLAACRVFLGFEGLAEQLAQIRRERPKPRAPTPTERYLDALYLEKEQTDLGQATRLYERLLDGQGVPARLRTLARERLDLCRERLGQKGAS